MLADLSQGASRLPTKRALRVYLAAPPPMVEEQTMASGVEEERVRPEVEGEEEEDDDERPQLSAAAAMALREFLEQRLEGEKGEGDGGGVELVPEDWRLSQFWYDDRTARELAAEVARLTSGLPGAAVACVA
ncbi:hypothetical protein QYE76_061830 [Lolium multiflorum]|uniref:Uncharacterized protein n=1 Tax=Lolium multiflorum TaxID=4521 RepID=A0AAD8S438_LOLMU|nr:hypothetical protein QYE76_061830 [Lolium multiflorum]